MRLPCLARNASQKIWKEASIQFEREIDISYSMAKVKDEARASMGKTLASEHQLYFTGRDSLFFNALEEASFSFFFLGRKQEIISVRTNKRFLVL